MIENFGFSELDKLLIFWCPVAAAFGGCLRFFSQARNYDRLFPTGEDGELKQPKWIGVSQGLAAMEWLFGHVVLSAGAGLLLGLYFVGMIGNEANAIARLLGISILLGYIAPQLWSSQEKAILSKVEKIIKRELKKLEKE